MSSCLGYGAPGVAGPSGFARIQHQRQGAAGSYPGDVDHGWRPMRDMFVDL
eukprot:CAMPEP_0194491162 /NCGR_PEP_ID=MMETSP0253-20130528/10140_1 /TAXON_ID=2966 /ORGANISM="Noctiluca scintillans" /LENGTH=50 /DNA_ID=CAMNT_0039331867 /DNA_START=339 /DNA_END=491 /DNA_ORIENTATION=-